MELLNNELGIIQYNSLRVKRVVIIIGVLIAGVDTVSFPEWEAIDRHEVGAGEKKGKPREKIVELTQMMDIVHKHR